jgi:hypothetical protein
MSHRVTTQTEIKDRKLAEAALRQMGSTFAAEGNGIRITSGPLNRAFIDLGTGIVSGDTDYRHNPEVLASVSAFYAEAKLRNDVQLRGGSVNDRTETADRIVIVVRQSEAQLG